jgi:predicted SAM-dependent methyltransferase
VYGEHLLEHLEPGEAWRLLLEAGRALRPGGVIRLSTPSLEWVMKAQYDDDPDLPRDRAITQTYTINRAFRGWGHRFLYSRPMLERLLHGAGFGDLRFERYGDSERPDLRGLEHHEDHGWAGGFQHVWIVEATRGPDPLVISDELPGELEREFGRYVASGH